MWAFWQCKVSPCPYNVGFLAVQSVPMPSLALLVDCCDILKCKGASALLPRIKDPAVTLCTGVQAYLKTYGENMHQLLEPYTQNSSRSAVFATSCPAHILPRNMVVNGVSLDEAVTCWVRTRHASCGAIDAPWPVNNCTVH